MADFKTLDDFDLTGKRVLLRADLNVPVENGKVTDATRIERLLPTIREIVKKDGKAILLSHFGRPKGKVDKAQSLEMVVPAIADVFGHQVGFIDTDWTDRRTGPPRHRWRPGWLGARAGKHPFPPRRRSQ